MQEIKKINDRIYYVTHEEETDRPVIGIIVGDNKVLIVDAGNSAKHSEMVLDFMKSNNIPYPDYCILTHWHWDHVFGADNLKSILVAHEKTTEKLEEMKGYSWDDDSLAERVRTGEEIEFGAEHIKVEFEDRNEIKIRIPDISFSEKMVFDLGGVTCEVIHVAGDHSPDSTVVYIPQEKIVFLGDCLYENLYSNPERYTYDNVFKLVDKLLAIDADIFIEAHTSLKKRKEELEVLFMLKELAEKSRKFDNPSEFIEYLKEEKIYDLNEDIEELATLFTRYKQ